MDILKSNIIVGVSTALAVTVLAPVLVPVLATAGRPLAKSLLKGGLMLYERSREAVAVAGETIEDLVAEIRAEEAMGATAPTPAAAPAPPAPAPTPAAAGEPQRSGSNGQVDAVEGRADGQAAQAGVAAA